MLKLEKSKKNREINIRLRQPTNLFDRYFLIALATAIGIHLLAALVFHVRLFSFGQIETLLPATRAQAHFIKGSTDERDALVTAQVDMQGRITPAQLAPVLSQPTLQPLPPPQVLKPVESFSNPVNPLLVYSENKIEDHLLENLNLPVFKPAIKIQAFGFSEEFNLSNLSEKESTLLLPKKFSPKNLLQDKLVYNVLVEFETGEVFWYQLEEASQNKTHREIAESMLKKIRFYSNHNEFVQNGSIEFTFSSGDV